VSGLLIQFVRLFTILCNFISQAHLVISHLLVPDSLLDSKPSLLNFRLITNHFICLNNDPAVHPIFINDLLLVHLLSFALLAALFPVTFLVTILASKELAVSVAVAALPAVTRLATCLAVVRLLLHRHILGFLSLVQPRSNLKLLRNQQLLLLLVLPQFKLQALPFPYQVVNQPFTLDAPEPSQLRLMLISVDLPISIEL
jgi:hypothetical protein